MSWRGQTVSVCVHAAALGAVVFAVKGGGTHAEIPIAVFVGERSDRHEEKREEPPKPEPLARAEVKAARPAGVPRAAAAPVAAGPAAAAPVHDFGLVLDGEGDGLPGMEIPRAALAPTAAPEAAPPEPAPRRPAPVAAGGCEESAPQPIERVDIEYPVGIPLVEGMLRARLAVDADGRVTRVEIVSPVDPALDRAAVAALSRWRFRPARRCDRAVSGTYTIEVRMEASN